MPILMVLLTATAAAGACSKSSGSTTGPSPLATTLDAPTPISPANATQVDTTRPVLRVTNIPNAGGAERQYQFQIAENPEFIGGLVGSVPEGTDGTTAFQVEEALQTETEFHWHVRVLEGTAVGRWSETVRFMTRANLSPSIASLTVSSDRAEVGRPLTLVAVVTDPDTPLDELVYEWSAAGGTFVGTGTTVDWRPPVGGVTPAPYDLTLTVVETFTRKGADGASEMAEHRVSRSVQVHLNDSDRELEELVLSFLGDFSDSTVDPVTAVRHFSDNCVGKQDELDEITANRATFLILSAAFEVSSVGIDAARLQATVTASCEFVSETRQTGAIETAQGVCMLRAVYEPYEWLLCESRFDEFPSP